MERSPNLTYKELFQGKLVMLEDYVASCFASSDSILPMTEVLIGGVPYRGVKNEIQRETSKDHGLVDDSSVTIVFQRSVLEEDPEEGTEAVIDDIDFIVSKVRGGPVAVSVTFRHDDSEQ